MASIKNWMGNPVFPADVAANGFDWLASPEVVSGTWSAYAIWKMSRLWHIGMYCEQRSSKLTSLRASRLSKPCFRSSSMAVIYFILQTVLNEQVLVSKSDTIAVSSVLERGVFLAVYYSQVV